jgi:hypothetical protein
MVWFIDTLQTLPQHVSAIHCHHRGFVVPQKMLKQYLCCGCMWMYVDVCGCMRITIQVFGISECFCLSFLL